MPRPLLEIWRELNRDRNGEPSSLLKPTLAEMACKPSSLLLSEITRKPSSPMQQMIADIARKPLSLTEQMIADMARKERLSRLRQESGITERVLRKPRPASPAQPGERKRKPGGDRPRCLTQEQIDRGIHILRSLPGMSLEAAWKTLEEAGIKCSKSSVYRHIFTSAY
jgi:hypothetical protein